MGTTFKRVIPLLIFFSLSIHTFADSITEIVKKGNEAYQQENYSEAIAAYEEVATGNTASAALYYNLGNAYFKSGFNAKALLWYERALRLDPSDEDIQHNIAFVNQKIMDRIDPIPETAFARWWNRCSHSLSERGWSILAIIGSLLAVGCIVISIFSANKPLRAAGFIVFWIALIGIIFSFIFASKEKNRFSKQDEAIVMNLVVEAKTAPNDKARTTFIIHEGLKVQVTNEMNNYVEIRIPNGEKGWINKSTIEKI